MNTSFQPTARNKANVSFAKENTMYAESCGVSLNTASPGVSLKCVLTAAERSLGFKRNQTTGASSATFFGQKNWYRSKQTVSTTEPAHHFPSCQMVACFSLSQNQTLNTCIMQVELPNCSRARCKSADPILFV